MNIIITSTYEVLGNRAQSASLHALLCRKNNLDHNFWTKGDSDSILHIYVYSLRQDLSVDIDLDFWHTFEKRV